jgi:hypothetical protein
MSTGLATRPREPLPEAVEKALIANDLKSLSAEQRLGFYKSRCEAAGLDPRARPFIYVELKGKLTLYATKECAEQLNGMHGISHKIVSKGPDGAGLYVAEVEALMQDGRATTDIGVVVTSGLKGEELANAMMKAVTKAKRRATLSLCGLGDVLSDAELDTVQVRECTETGQPKPLENNSGHATGQYCSDEDAKAYLDEAWGYCARRNSAWLDKLTRPGGEVWEGAKDLVANDWQMDGHLAKWAVGQELLDPASVEKMHQNRLKGHLVGILWARSPKLRNQIKRELVLYVDNLERLERERMDRLNPPDDEAGDEERGEVEEDAFSLKGENDAATK